MIIGILSDTHGDIHATNRAIELLVSKKAEYLIHCGDVGCEAVLDALSSLPSVFVFGNNDYEGDELEAYGNSIGVACLQYGGDVVLDGKRISVTHGDRPTTVQRFLAPENQADYLFTGHSHVQHDRRVGRVRWINPGALYRAAVKTVATLDLSNDLLAIWPVAV